MTSLAGQWVLDRALSDNPVEAMEAADAIAAIEGRGRMPRGGGSGRRRMGRGGERDEGTTETGNQEAAEKSHHRESTEPLALPERFSIDQDGGVVEFASPQGGHDRYDPLSPQTEFSAGEFRADAGWLLAGEL